MMSFDRSKKWFWIFWWSLLFIGLWEVLLRAENPSLMMDDSGETVASAWILGIPHPPGYPLYNLIGRLASFLPLGSVAFRSNLLSALFTVVSLFFILQTCRTFYDIKSKENPNDIAPQWMIEIFLVLIALSFLFCQTVFAQSLTAKGGIYTFTLCLLSVMMFLITKPISILKKYYLVFFLFSIGLTNHWETTVLWSVLIFLWLKNSGSEWTFKRVFYSFTFFLIGISTYLYLPIRAQLNPKLNFENPVNLHSFWQLVSRNYYSSSVNATSHAYFWWPAFNEYLGILSFHWWPGFILFAFLGLYFLYKRRMRLFWPLVFLYIVTICSVIIYPEFDRKNLFFIGIYLVSTEGLIAFWAFCSVFIIRDLKSRLVQRSLIILSIVLSIFWSVYVFNRQDKSWFVLQSDYGVNLLKELPFDAVVFVEADQDVFPLYYLKYVQNSRPDVFIIPISHLTTEWGYREIVHNNEDRLNLNSTNVRSFGDAIHEIVRVGESEKLPIFFSHYIKPLTDYKIDDINRHLYSWGLTYRLEETSPRDIDLSNWVFRISSIERLRNLEKIKDLSTENSSSFYLRSYVRADLLAGDYFMKENDLQDAFGHYQHALMVNPKMEGVYFALAEYFYKNGDFELAKLLCEKEIKNDPGLGEAYFLLGNICLKINLFGKAIEAFDYSLRINPDSRSAVQNRTYAIDSQASGRMSGWQSKPITYYQIMADSLRSKGITFLADAADETAKNSLVK